MSNRVCIQRCEFLDYPNRNAHYGFRAYDDYGQTYLNTATVELMAVEHLEFLSWMAKNVDDECLGAMLDSVRERESGLYIDDKWHDWEAIRPILSDGPPIESGGSDEQKNSTTGRTPQREQS